MTTQSSHVGRERDLAPPVPPGVPDAAAVMGQAGSENFTVASRVLPRAQRQHLLAVYGAARLIDDIGDDAPGDREAALDWVEGELERAADGRATHPVLVALTPTLRQCDLPLDPFRRLVAANRQDQLLHRYATFDDLLAYCALSANPVGELVLRVFGVATPERLARSDQVCSGLQVTEHLQDVGEDLQRGRVYLPAEDLDRFGCTDADLVGPEASARLRAVVRFEVGRARALLGAGPRLAATLHGRLRLAVAGYVAGGLAALDAIDAVDGDVLGVDCRPRPHRIATQLGSVLAAATRKDAA